jgi:mycofactocin precursor
MSADDPGTEATTTGATTEVITEDTGQEEAEELLVEEISIDGICGVY